MDMEISLKVAKPQNPTRYIDETPVYSMGHNLLMVVEFTNKGTKELEMPDPNTSQETILWLLAEDETEENGFELNPGSIDITGERTAPVSHNITLQPKESTSIFIELNKYCVDKCFLPGKYKLHIEFLSVKSPLLKYAVEFQAESVPKLIEISIDEKTDSWIREQSILWLQKLPIKPKIESATENESELETVERKRKNQENAKLFLGSWPNEKKNEYLKNFFEDIRLK